MINFYRWFVQNSANILMRLYDLLAEHNKLPKNAMINWMLEQEQAFNKSKNDLAQAAFLAYPAPNAEIFLAADASDTAVAAVLYQKIDNQLVEPLGLFSKRLDRAQIKWTIFSRQFWQYTSVPSTCHIPCKESVSLFKPITKQLSMLMPAVGQEISLEKFVTCIT